MSINATVASSAFYRAEVDGSILCRFDKIVSRYPRNLAINSQSSMLTYQRLNELANYFGLAIDSVATPRSDCVVIYLDNDISVIVAMVAVLKAGRFFAVIDPRQPVEFNKKLIENLGPSIVVSTNQLKPPLNELIRDDYILVDCNAPEFDGISADAEISAPIQEICSILFTSGSSGQSKGIIRNHRTVLHRSWLHAKFNGAGPGDRQSLLFGSSFGASTSDIFASLLNGSCLCRFDVLGQGIFELAEWLVREKITLLHLPISLFRRLLDELDEEQRQLRLRLISLGGDSLFKGDVERCRRHVGEHCIIEHRLSTTETSVLTRFVIDRDTKLENELVPAGFAVPDKDVFIIDKNNKPVGVDTVGEIAVRSSYLSPGYWRNPDLTRKRYLFANNGDDRPVYLTGDLGCIRAGGCMEYFGRHDSQVKIRGFRIDTKAIEAVLCSQESVVEAIVVSANDKVGERRLLAYIVWRLKAGRQISQLRGNLKKLLPDYMIPALFVSIDKLPLTPGGKVDHRALPAADRFNCALEETFVPPRTDLEKNLAGIWAEVLEMDTVGIHDDFFELGGHSLLALRLFGKVERIFGRSLPLSTLFSAATVAELASVIEDSENKQSWTAMTPIRPYGRKTPLFCIHGGGGEILMYHDLAKYLNVNRPIYAVRQDDHDGKQVAPRTVEKMAADYVDEVRSVQSTGPYLLLGYCLGGLIAYEMAQQLTGNGQDVGILTIVETRNPAVNRSCDRRGIFYGLSRQFSKIRSIPPRSRYRYIVNEMRRLSQLNAFRTKTKLADKFRKLRIGYSHIRGRSIPVALRGHYLLDVNRQTVRGYVPKPYDGDIIVFQGRESSFKLRESWEGVLTGSIHLEIVPGDHGSIVKEPNVQVLSQKIGYYLESSP